MDPSSGEVPSAHFVIDVAPGEWEEHTWEWDAARKRMAITVRNNRKKAETFPGVVQLDGKTMIGKASPHAIRFSFQGDDALEWFTRGTTGAISLFRAERIDEAGPTAYGPVYFHGASERLTQIGRECLDRTAAAMTAKKKAKSLLLLSGHADPTEPGGELGRRALGDRRAVNARDYLELRGVPARRLLETYSVGDQRPACSDSTVPCAVRNRRVEMLLFR
jgi:YD repeat-containing protein